ncbi:MAG: HEAT repeat domain-containing protein [Pseudomonadota bacterium]
MNHILTLTAAALLATSTATVAQADTPMIDGFHVDLSALASGTLSDKEHLQLTALEGLMSAPPERAMPLLRKVLTGGHSDAVKGRALFVLAQIDLPEAQQLLADMARDSSGSLQQEAIRAIGINGEAGSLAMLADIYRSGNAETRESVLQAYLIADDTAAVFALAQNADSDEDFDRAVRVLGMMDAREELSRLAERGAASPGLIQAYAIAGDLDSLRRIAATQSNPEQRLNAIRSMGIVGGEEAGAALLGIYQDADDEATREAALQGMLITDHDEGVMQLFQGSSDPEEKRKLLRALVHMDSELALDLIDSTLLED